MAFLSDLKDVDLETQVRMLRDQISSLKELVAKRGNKGYGDASDAVANYYGDLSNAVASVCQIWASGEDRLVLLPQPILPPSQRSGYWLLALLRAFSLRPHPSENPASERLTSGNARLRRLHPRVPFPKEPPAQEMLELEAGSAMMAP
jgi:hypothetical protein